MNNLVSIIIPVFERLQSMRTCLSSLLRQTYNPYEIIIIDNGSADTLETMLAQDYPCVRYIHNTRNLGTAISRNQGIKASLGYYIWFLDSDVIVEDTNCLKTMVSLMENSPDKTIGAIGGEYTDPKTRFLIKKRVKPNLETQSLVIKEQLYLEAVDYLPTSNFFSTKSILQLTGGFRPDIPLCDDRWISNRIKENGYSIFVDSRVAVFHNIELTNRKGDLTAKIKDRISYFILISKWRDIILLPFYEIVSAIDFCNLHKSWNNDKQINKHLPSALTDTIGFKKYRLFRVLVIAASYISALLKAYIQVLSNFSALIKNRGAECNYLVENDAVTS